MRKTKIVCTLGPATDRDDILKKLILGGMNVARLNFSHGTHDEHLERVNIVRSLSKEFGKHTALLLDTKGPDIRLKKFKGGSVFLDRDDIFALTSKEIEGSEKIASITYEHLHRDINKGDIILIDDGLIELQVIEIKNEDVRCRVINGGRVSNNKGINIPGVRINMPFISEIDKKDLSFAIEHDFDFIAASFVRSSDDVEEIKKILEEKGGSSIKIIAKIENREGVDNIDDILRVSDGVMVARGDMGVEIPFEELPAIQKDIIKKANIAGKPVITATQMLDSMIRNPRPTRAEITDVANAIYDGTSAIMLSGETSIGEYPVEAVLAMTKIALNAEAKIDYIENFNKTHITISRNVTNAIGHATCDSAHLLGASAIITVTKSGHTARMISKYRPGCPIIGATTSEKICRQLSLSWGVYPVITSTKDTTDEIFEQSIESAFKTGLIKDGDLVIITGGVPVGISGTTNTMKIHIVGDVLAQGKGVNKLSASGIIHVIHDNIDMNFNAGEIIVIKKTSDDILPLLKNASAIVTEEDEKTSKAVIAGKTLGLPVITNVKNATEILKSGIVATVNASTGQIYSGIKPDKQIS